MCGHIAGASFEPVAHGTGSFDRWIVLIASPAAGSIARWGFVLAQRVDVRCSDSGIGKIRKYRADKMLLVCALHTTPHHITSMAELSIQYWQKQILTIDELKVSALAVSVVGYEVITLRAVCLHLQHHNARNCIL